MRSGGGRWGRDSVHGSKHEPWGVVGDAGAGTVSMGVSMHSGEWWGTLGGRLPAPAVSMGCVQGPGGPVQASQRAQSGKPAELVEGGADGTWRGWRLPLSHPLTTARTHWGCPGSPVQTLPEAPSGCLDTSAWAVRTGDTLHLTAAQWGPSAGPCPPRPLSVPCLSPDMPGAHRGAFRDTRQVTQPSQGSGPRGWGWGSEWASGPAVPKHLLFSRAVWAAGGDSREGPP